MFVDRSSGGRDTRADVARLVDEGLSGAAISARLGISRATVSYHRKRLDRLSSPACARRYDWSEIQRYYDAGHSIRECQLRFGFARAAWANAARRGAVVSRPQATPLEEMLRDGTRHGRWNLKRRLIAAGIKANVCEECGLTEWCGRPIALELHHRNGVGRDNRLENLAILCPNCHSQTENFGGRNAAA
jgi:5-methylcytosine-specific restriction endonuclease McrA